MDLKKNLLQYSLNIASTIAELYSKNEFYHNVRCYLPKQNINIKENILNDIILSSQKSVLIDVNAYHIKLNNYIGMNPKINLEYIPEANKVYISTAHIIDEFNNIIGISNIEIVSAEDLGKSLYDLMIDTQDYYKQSLINS